MKASAFFTIHTFPYTKVTESQIRLWALPSAYSTRKPS